MKKFTLLTLLIFNNIFLHAQVEITSDDIPGTGSLFSRIHDTIPGDSLMPGNAGANLEWDFSTMNTHFIDTIEFLDPANTPYANMFPGANQCIQMGNEIPYAYTVVSPDSLYVLGAVIEDEGFDDEIVSRFDPVQLLMLFPTTYGSAFEHTSAFSATLYFGQTVTLPGIPYPVFVDSVKIKNQTHTDSEIDGWGLLKTPYGSFETLREKRTEMTEDSLFAKSSDLGGMWIDITSWLGEDQKDTALIYSWLTKDVGFSVFELKVEPETGQVNEATCLEIEGNAGSSTKMNRTEESHAYPIPANETLHIDMDTDRAADINIYDLTGTLIAEKRVNKFPAKINISDFSGSIYFYTIRIKGQVAESGKFTIAR